MLHFDARVSHDGDACVQGYFVQTLKILQAVCKVCSRILLPDTVRATYLRQMASRRKERGSSKATIKSILVDCKRISSTM